ncbi:hypothetical protein BMS3Abin01_00002 [bacterium BMS3Abin01]|nr:hypothetical protein BMS3Abin01_00002 [bacterium BMS3Abin01]
MTGQLPVGGHPGGDVPGHMYGAGYPPITIKHRAGGGKYGMAAGDGDIGCMRNTGFQCSGMGAVPWRFAGALEHLVTQPADKFLGFGVKVPGQRPVHLEKTVVGVMYRDQVGTVLEYVIPPLRRLLQRCHHGKPLHRSQQGIFQQRGAEPVPGQDLLSLVADGVYGFKVLIIIGDDQERHHIGRSFNLVQGLSGVAVGKIGIDEHRIEVAGADRLQAAGKDVLVLDGEPVAVTFQQQSGYHAGVGGIALDEKYIESGKRHIGFVCPPGADQKESVAAQPAPSNSSIICTSVSSR